ncbi:ATP-dependent hsl protease ATP-binding subunit HslU [Gracilibacillus boraciitolerans JCM 21714]|uniref:ATP-dependent protease ATPase subunit HslU n=1 Tax=Gracilibacillus boraciitolerans JCM 21714 TaxID=1298598 RepID=W4VFN9_9BACI|nr:HslU--HslV peptidase ATPase subunit [Gracilibacillus boraciitolerans]GAE91638.1 ATP-dependent hsl protease ATP-binding subunit HslU [Gracilibacillus boraciitolerans JCM 21714]
MSLNLTPKKIVEKLSEYIIGQENAKKAVAVALRNRYRRMQLSEELRNEIVPKNILMIGPTGVGKTEVARRLAKLVGAPFIKVEATKYTEVGYVGRDVESMVRDLVETSIRMVKEDAMKEVEGKAEKLANNRIVELFVPSKKKNNSTKNPFDFFLNQNQQQSHEDQTQDKEAKESIQQQRQQTKKLLELGELEDRTVTIEVEEQTTNMFDMLQGSGMEQMGMNMQDALGSLIPKKKKKRSLLVKDARKVLIDQEAQKLIDMDHVIHQAIEKAEQMGGIIFIDEIDKVAVKQEQSSTVSREGGVQRDILPIVEGSSIVTKYGTVKTDHMLFIAAGAFHMAKPSDLIPELQGRFPIRVEFEKLTITDFERILKEPSNSLLTQYKALLETEGITISFTNEAIYRLAEIAYQVNQETDNIGARRLHTILEKLLEELSYEASDIGIGNIEITEHYVNDKLKAIATNRDLSQFIL